MSKKQKAYTGSLSKMHSKKIYLNIKELESGTYTLNIMNKNKLIKQIIFKK